MLLLKAYDRGRAVAYARRWANARNPLFITAVVADDFKVRER